MVAKLITVAQQKGGAGKTTLAIHLATAFALQGRSVCLVDIDPQGSVAAWGALREARRGQDDALQVVAVAGWRAGSELDRRKRSCDIVIIDSPPHAEAEAKLAIRAADLALIPVQLTPLDRWAATVTIDLARKERVPILLVPNRVTARNRLADTVRAELEAEGLPVAASGLGNRTVFAASLGEGAGVGESAPGSVAAAEIDALAAEIAGRLGLV